MYGHHLPKRIFPCLYIGCQKKSFSINQRGASSLCQSPKSLTNWKSGRSAYTLCRNLSLTSLSRRYKKFEKSCSSKLISVFGQNRTKNYKNTFFLPASPRVLNHLRSLCTVVCSDRSRKKSFGLKIILSKFQISIFHHNGTNFGIEFS